MNTLAAVAGTFCGVLILFQLTKNVGTKASPSTGLGEVTASFTSIIKDVTGDVTA